MKIEVESESHTKVVDTWYVTTDHSNNHYKSLSSEYILFKELVKTLDFHSAAVALTKWGLHRHYTKHQLEINYNSLKKMYRTLINEYSY